MWGILAWLAGSKIGRLIATTGIVIASVFVIALRLMAIGAAGERAKQTEQSLKNIRERIKTDEKVRDMPIDDVRDKLRSDWMRND
ncbi:hypothetical protein [Maritalea porphyrae]|uniref:hypothetical protein n=1 Tax=Maritalea porphyrae TaxID=880732 RepID=UPI0022AFEE01|nr:hypothetical protein [Maritalea porphyrae]MCZ4270874.1 hypothetical protein [Maritalea porphyrae]